MDWPKLITKMNEHNISNAMIADAAGCSKVQIDRLQDGRQLDIYYKVGAQIVNCAAWAGVVGSKERTSVR